MKAELKRLHSPDAIDLRNYRPKDESKFALFVQVMAGPAGDDAAESFDLTVCTPQWVEEQVADDGVFNGIHHLVMRRYDYAKLERFVRDYCAACEGASWHEVAAKLGRIGRWEFYEYRG